MDEQEFDLDLKEIDTKPLNKKQQFDIIDDILKSESNRNIEKLDDSIIIERIWRNR